MLQLRTYRFLPLLIGLVLLLGAAAPAVQAACALMPDAAEETAPPCHGPAAPAPTPPLPDAPCGMDLNGPYHLCCGPDTAVLAAATILVEPARHVLPAGDVLSDRVAPAAAPPSAQPRTRAPSYVPAASRQALLATFLI